MNKFLLSFLVLFSFTTPGKSDLSSQYSSLGDVTNMCREDNPGNRTIWVTTHPVVKYGSEMERSGIIVFKNQVYYVPYNSEKLPNCDYVRKIGPYGEQFTQFNNDSLFGTDCYSGCQRLFKIEDQNGSKAVNFYHKVSGSGKVEKVTFLNERFSSGGTKNVYSFSDSIDLNTR